MTWQDDLPNSEVSVDSFADGCAIAVPLDVNAPPSSIMMGFTSPVNIWHWRADKDVQYWEKKEYVRPANADFTYPFEQEEILSVTNAPLETAVADLVAQRAGSLTDKPVQAVQGRGVWSDGKWSVVFKRVLMTDDAQRDCQFPWGQRLAAFAVWDGDQDDRGGRKSMSKWVTLHIEHSRDSKAAHSESIQPGGTSWLGGLSSLSLLASAHASSGSGQPKQAGPEPCVITVKAKRFEYIPNRIYVRQGQTVTLRMESLDVTHGLYLDGYGLNIKANPGQVTKATFVADKRGRFTFRCSETCR
jgi:plastocyanin